MPPTCSIARPPRALRRWDRSRALLAPEEGMPGATARTDRLRRGRDRQAGATARHAAYPDDAVAEIERITASAARSSRCADAIGHPTRWATCCTIRTRRANCTCPSRRWSARIRQRMRRWRSRCCAIRAWFRSAKAGCAACWPARPSGTADGPLAQEHEVWLDGGHNPSAGAAGATFRRAAAAPGSWHAGGEGPCRADRAAGGQLRQHHRGPCPDHDFTASRPRARRDLGLFDAEALARIRKGGLPVLVAGSPTLRAKCCSSMASSPTDHWLGRPRRLQVRPPPPPPCRGSGDTIRSKRGQPPRDRSTWSG